MLKGASPVSAVNKIGPKYKKLLEKLEIYTVEDLLYHFPFRYDDYANKKPINKLVEGDVVTVEAVLGPVNNIFTRNNKRLTRAKAVDFSGETQIIWFNQHYLKKVLQTGKTYNISGKIGNFSNKLAFISPEIEIKKENSVNTGRLVPVYPETSGVSSKWLRSKISSVLASELNIEEFLPQEILKENKFEPIIPNLNKIHFPEQKKEIETARSRFEFEELFIELLAVEKRKHEWSDKLEGIAMDNKIKEINKFVKKLPFELTNSQKQAVEEILEDMQDEHPMNRLLEGDVGTGKTIVAMIGSLFAHKNDYKTLYMAPTEILAKQHFETFTKLLPNLNISLVTGSKKTENFEKADIIIGTHALLFKDNFEEVGFIVIDEQHRFGVEQRGKISELGKDNKVPHVLTMTATPIPRTLALTIYGDLSISVLKTHPNTNRKVTTKVIPEKKRNEAYEWILKRNEPAFIVCPLIEESESKMFENVKAAEVEFEKLQKGVFKGVSMGLLHGRMKPKEKEEIMQKFKSGEIKILVSTPVIEVGIDIPDATIIVIESAERYGLASLHQLRGRVGRGEKEGFCFVFMSNNSKSSYERLKNLERVNNGLELAEIDMKIRGKGDVFGTAQHGFKKFRIANLDNFALLEKAKQSAQEYFPRIEEYPLLKEKLSERKGEYIPSN